MLNFNTTPPPRPTISFYAEALSKVRYPLVVKIVKQLMHLYDGGRPIDAKHGMCYEIESIIKYNMCKSGSAHPACDLYKLRADITEITSTWPKWSGGLRYPVPHPAMTPMQAFTCVDDLWGYQGAHALHREYHINRKELCLYVAQQLILKYTGESHD